MESDHAENTPLASTLREFLRDFAALAGRRGIAAAGLVATGAVFEGLSLALLIPLISLGIGSDLPAGRIGRATAVTEHFFGAQNPLSRLALFLGIFGVFVLLRAVIVSFRDVRIAALQAGFVEALRLRIAQSLVGAQWDQVTRLRHARIAHLMSGEIQRIGAMTQLLLQFAVSCAMLATQCILVLLLAPAFAAVSLGLLVIGAALFLPVVRRAHRLGRVMTEADLSLLDSTAQFLGGLKLAISQNLQGRFIGEFRQSLGDLKQRQLDYFRQQSLVRVTLMTLPALAAGLLVLFGFAVFHLAPATLIAIVLIITRMVQPVGQIQQGVQQIVHSMPGYEKIIELERELSTMPGYRLSQSHVTTLSEGAIKLQNVTFLHASDGAGSARGVERIDLTLQPGEIVGITGSSGAGKTTFADLLVGLYPPQRGSITIADVPLDGSTLASWRSRVGYVPQDPFLFHDTIRRNLNWANTKSSEKDIWEALSLVGADSIVRGLELGLDTIVGERGMLLSGGERQRIALARAILRRPRLLVLDEATGAIDVESERRILESLRQLEPRPTILIIAHRLESLALCGRRFRFGAGRCIEEGVAENVARHV